MSQYMLLCYQEAADGADECGRDAELPLVLELQRSLREEGLFVGMQRLKAVESATSVRVRAGQTEITDGPFAVTKEYLAGYYLVECDNLDEALRIAARTTSAVHGTVEVRPVMSAEEWVEVARAAGADVPDEAVDDLA
jgi:hypothetical protein